MPRLRARYPAPATVAHQIAGYWSGDHRFRRGDEDVQHCYSHSWRIALLERFWQARHPPRYAAYLTPSSPRFQLSSITEAGYNEQAASYRNMSEAATAAGNAENQASTFADVTGIIKGVAA